MNYHALNFLLQDNPFTFLTNLGSFQGKNNKILIILIT